MTTVLIDTNAYGAADEELRHAANGVGDMAVCEGITTPFDVGSAPGNHPE